MAELLQIDKLLERRPSALSAGSASALGTGAGARADAVPVRRTAVNLDAKLCGRAARRNQRLHEQLHASIVYVTHDQIEAMTLGTHIAVLNQGAVQQFGTPDEIYERPANMFVADFMGSPPMNLIPPGSSAASGVAGRRADHGPNA